MCQSTPAAIYTSHVTAKYVLEKISTPKRRYMGNILKGNMEDVSSCAVYEVTVIDHVARNTVYTYLT